MSQRSIDELPQGTPKVDSLVAFADPATGIAYKIDIKEFLKTGIDEGGSFRAPVFMNTPVQKPEDLPKTGLAGELRIVLSTKSIYGYDEISGSWINGGNIAGPAGETLKISASVDFADHLPGRPAVLTTVLVTGTKELYIYDPGNPQASAGPATPAVPEVPGTNPGDPPLHPAIPAVPPAGWCALGRIDGPRGEIGPRGDPGLDKGTVENQILRWSVSADKWVPGSAPVVTPAGNSDKDVMQWNAAFTRWDSVPLANILPPGTDKQFLRFDATANAWQASSTLDGIDTLAFSANTLGEEADRIIAGDFTTVPVADPAEDTALVTVSAVRGYVGTELKLENISDCTELATAEDGQVPVWNATNTRWEPQHFPASPIIYLGTGAFDPAQVGSAGNRFGMAADTKPDPTAFPPLPGDQYIDLATGNVSVFTGTGGTRLPGGTPGNIGVNPASLDITPPQPLISASDFVGVVPANDQVPVWNAAANKFTLTGSLASRAYVDLQVEQLAVGLAHSVAVQSISNDPPADLAHVQGKYYIVGTAPTGDWVGHTNEVAFYTKGSGGSFDWQFDMPTQGEAHLVEDQSAIFSWSSTTSQWVKTANASTANLSVENLNNVTHNPKLDGDLLVYSSLANRWLGAQPSTIANLIVNPASLYQVGDLKQSVLTEPQFKTMLGADAANWCLADGRDITGSAFATITGQNTIPDLRGGFLRMAGVNNARTAWNGGALGSFNEYKTARPRNTAFTGSTNSAGSHTHTIWGRRMNQYGGAGYASVPQTFCEGISANGATITDGRYMNADGAHTHTVTIDGGDDESSPRSYSINIFIKIN